MKFAVIGLFILGFISMAIFSAYVMSVSGHGHSGCLAKAINGGDCPAESSLSALANFHLGAAKSFSSAIFLAFALAIGLIALDVLRQPRFSFSVLRRGIFNLSVFFNKIALIRWIARHENSPSLA